MYNLIFTQIIKDVKLGRLPQDSVTLRKDSVLIDEFYQQRFDVLQQSGFTKFIQSLEPKQRGYKLLKAGIRKFRGKLAWEGDLRESRSMGR